MQVPHRKKYQTLLLSPDQRGIEQAANFLSKDELVAFPTETVFGLGASALSSNAVEKIFSVKGRPSYNPLIIHINDPNEINVWANLPQVAEKLVDCFCPGPLTLVLPQRFEKCKELSSLITGKLKSVAIRVPSNPIAQSLIKILGKPIAAPSANLSGKITATRTKDVLKYFDGLIPAIIDHQPQSIGVESTIIGFEDEKPVLLRAGGITTEDFKSKLNLSISKPKTSKKSLRDIVAPGMLGSHYAPESQLRLNATDISPDELYLGFGQMPPLCEGICLSEDANLEEAAFNLFSALADLDTKAIYQNKKTIAVAPIPDFGLGQAINDRLRRAAAKRD